MNENSQPGFGKISVHGDGMGAPTPQLIEARAREIALIAERNPDEFTDADWEQARRELMGTVDPRPPEEIEHSEDMREEWEVTPNATGERAARAGLDDDESLGERLVEGGLEEAAHDQMLEARREDLSQES
ncbi:MAG: hypothetical protein ACJ8KU_10650 [Chthoniobacterales bacterium]